MPTKEERAARWNEVVAEVRAVLELGPKERMEWIRSGRRKVTEDVGESISD